MEQDTSALLENDGWSVFKSIPVTGTWPGKHILPEFSIALCIFAYKTVRLEHSRMIFHSNLRSTSAIQAAGILLYPIRVPTWRMQVSTTRREAHAKVRS